MNRMQVYIPDDMYIDLKNAALSAKKPMAMFIRDGLSQVLYSDAPSPKSNPLQGFVGKLKTTKKIDGVQAVNEYYQKR